MSGYGCIVIDDPWQFDNTRSNGAAEDHYKTMTIPELEKLPIYPADNAHLYMWTTASHRQSAHWLMQQRGFGYRLDIVWVKTSSIETRLYRDADAVIKVGHFITDNTEEIPGVGERLKLQIGQGNYFRHAHESCLFGVRGSLVHPEGVTVPTVIFAPRPGEHSQKPEILQDIAELMSPGPRLEMFARRHRPGWVCWGDQLPPLAVTQQPAFLEGTAQLAQMLRGK